MGHNPQFETWVHDIQNKKLNTHKRIEFFQDY